MRLITARLAVNTDLAQHLAQHPEQERTSAAPATNQISPLTHAQNVFSLEVAFKLPEVPSTAKCTLGFQVTGKNSESDWVAFVPDGSAEIIVSAFTTPMDPSKDTYYHHAKVGDVVNSIKISTTLAGGLNAAFSPSIVPCSSASGLLFEPGASTMILSWERKILYLLAVADADIDTEIGDKPDGVQIVVDDAN